MTRMLYEGFAHITLAAKFHSFNVLQSLCEDTTMQAFIDTFAAITILSHPHKTPNLPPGFGEIYCHNTLQIRTEKIPSI